jgi:hypothetical protein
MFPMAPCCLARVCTYVQPFLRRFVVSSPLAHDNDASSFADFHAYPSFLFLGLQIATPQLESSLGVTRGCNLRDDRL